MPTSLTIENLTPNSLDNLYSENTTYVGIDFGTSTTVVSFAFYDINNKQVRCKTMSLNQKLPDGAICSSPIIPSVIAFYNGRLFMGEGASELKYELVKNKNIWYSFKMELGEDVGPKYFDSELGKNSKFQILNAKDATLYFFMYLKRQIELYVEKNELPSHIEYAVSIPASFEANQRKDLVDALMGNQMDVSKQSLIDEPNAAFLSYIYESTNENNPIIIPDEVNPKLLVLDFGAGTCDISILEVGLNAKGVYTKNLSISKFEKLGGDDIDNYIVYEILLPSLIKQNGLNEDDFITSEKRKIANRLLKCAENLKINICKAIALMRDSFNLESLSKEDYKVSVKEKIEIKTTKGILKANEVYLTSLQFSDIMEVFLRKKKGIVKPDHHVGNEYNSIYSLLDSSLKKAGINAVSIDYVLFIGGSCKNPYIQEAINKWFPEAKLLLPSDTQIHVSKGAAIHSLMYNCYGLNVVQPITSEPICVVTKDNILKTLIPAGTSIPTNTIKITDLVVSSEGQKIIELPICISSKNKLLTNIIISSSKSEGFSSGSQVDVELELTPDKLLLATISVENEICFIEPVNPFANKELTTQERLALQAEKTAYQDAANNNGVPSKSALVKLGKAYEEAKLYLQAAETYVHCNDLYPSSVNANKIGNCYSSAGKCVKALYYAELDYEHAKNEISAFNLAYRYRNIDKNKFLKYLKEALEYNPNKPHALFELGKYEKQQGLSSGEEKIEKAFNIWKEQYEAGILSSVDYTWLPSAAETLGKYKLASEIRMKAQDIVDESSYNIENVIKIKEE